VNRVHIPKCIEGTLAGYWQLIDGQPAFRCPKCKVMGLMVNHSVEPDGTVNASIACFPPCDYHEFGILDNWTYGKKEHGKPIVTV